MSFRSSIFVSLFFLAACSSSSNSPTSTSTTTVSPKTIAGVCSKLDSLSCAQPNCVDKFSLVQSNCKSQPDDVQALLDCLSVASFTCGGSPNIPRTNECEVNLDRVSGCAAGVSSGPGVAPFDAGAPSGTCTSASDCTTWSCDCADGTIVSAAGCTNGTCDGPGTVCSSESASLIAACKSHGGVN